jgi:hypothetical protein
MLPVRQELEPGEFDARDATPDARAKATGRRPAVMLVLVRRATSKER